MVNIEANRAEELEIILKELSSKIVDYVKLADSPEGSVGKYRDPRELSDSLKVAVSDKGEGIAGLLESADLLLDNSVVTWHKNFLEKLYAGTNPVGIASDLLLSVLNTNSHVFTASPALTVIERYIGKTYAGLFGFNGPHAGGLTFPGGSYSNITSMHMARSLLHEGTKSKGVYNTKLACFTSSHSHYSIEKAAILLGLGSESLFKVNVFETGEMDVEDLKVQISKAKEQGFTPFYINATAGSTVYGSFDDFEAIADAAEANDMWMHIDGSWGANVIFSDKQKHKMKGSHRANSLTVNPHKMLGVPCTCSFLLIPNDRQFQDSNSLQAPYLFHTASDDDDNFDLADGTMGCGRRADAVKLYLGWQYYGSSGYGQRIDHAFEMTAYLAEKIAKDREFELLSTNPPPCLQTCFFYHPPGLEATKENNTMATRAIVNRIFAKGKFLVDYSPHPTKGEFFRVVLNAPSVDKESLDSLVEEIKIAGSELFA
ncbi:L-aspartate decarboxylase dtxS4 [Wickerhamiella sorbophila]|uniref:L-aspartate decarboxylase dtxS4 n=1 Tax=Wickerhamiella sorbophila TaxID=45607 RepID=A0A2T0FLH5_9ASCO|nr:L-aspartate decarboxylase dtxS4 [Wickerhamiella sorbophila]PRT55836.1 L-aspartate decarboxylase dtxS4 [Wickerhamiella sorbophila]